MSRSSDGITAVCSKCGTKFDTKATSTEVARWLLNCNLHRLREVQTEMEKHGVYFEVHAGVPKLDRSGPFG